MKSRIGFLCALFLSLSQATLAQNKWGVGPKYVQYQKKDVFLSGVNYVPPRNWMLNLEVWDEKQVEEDIVGMKSLGVECIRFFPLWHLTQPTPGKLDETIMKRIDRVLQLGEKHHVTFQICLITGWMSGGTFLPDWAMGNIFKDPDIVKAQCYLVREFARRYKNNPAVQAFDFGNELNVLIEKMGLKLTPAEVDAWMQTIYKAFKEGDPTCLVTNGIGTGFDPYFNIEAISKSCDIMSLHSYPRFHGTAEFDPLIGQRNLYSGNFITEWTAMMGKPVLMQENGSSSADALIPSWLQIFYVSSWAEGATGYFWWGSHYIAPEYKVETPALRKEFSGVKMQAGELSADKTMGLLTTENVPNAKGKAYQECAEWIKKLGVGWVDQLPVCYILVPHTTEFYNTMRRYVTPFALAKQAHFDVKISWEDQEIPADAACVFIPGFALSASSKKCLATYLGKGGSVYQSYYNDLAPNLLVGSRPDTVISALSMTASPAEKDLTSRKTIRINNAITRDVSTSTSGAKQLAYYPVVTGKTEATKAAFLKTTVGKGAYYYLASNIEEALWKTFNPWAQDDSFLFYASLMPETRVRIDNKYVEFYHKKRGREELLVLINHENSEQAVAVSSSSAIRLEDAMKHTSFGRQSTFSFRLHPAEIMFLSLTR